jgi:hypothetical protein
LTDETIVNNGQSVIKLKLEKSQEMRELEEKLADYEAKLTIVAEKEFNRKKTDLETEARNLNLKIPEIEDPTTLKAVQKILDENKPTGYTGKRDIPLSGRQTGNFSGTKNENLPLGEKSYPDIPSMMKDLDQLAKSGSKDAQNTLKEIAKKELGQLKDFDFEYQGEITKGDGTWTKKRKVGL